MIHHKKSFLAGLAVGRSLRGWGGGASGGGLVPLCWNEPGVYDSFLIDYRYGLGGFSYGRFCNKTAIFGSAGEIIPTAAEDLGGGAVRIWADLRGQTKVRVYGNAKAGLSFADGRLVPAFAAEFWMDGSAPYELPYLAEDWRVRLPGLSPEEGAILAFPDACPVSCAESAQCLVPELTARDAAALEYT